MMNKILKYLHNKTKLEPSYFDQYTLVKENDYVKVIINQYTFLKSKKLYNIKIYCLRKIHFLLGRVLYGGLLSSYFYKLKLKLKWKWKNKKYIWGHIKYYLFYKHYQMIKEILMTEEQKKERARKIFESYGYSKERIEEILSK